MEKIRLFEVFAGVGSQYMALKRLGLNVEPVGISEWDINAILSYDAIHSENPHEDITGDYTLDEVNEELTVRVISSNGKDPLKETSLLRMPEKKKRKILSAMLRTNNMGSIMGNVAPDCDLFTYSFPCQDISVAGNVKGLEEGSGTRSSLLWECRRTIEVRRPKVLLMENVKNLVSKKLLPDFEKWIEVLDGLGYSSKWQILNGKDFGVPQNRERVFMVSVYGGDSYEFPTGFPLQKRLKDILETEVSEDHYVKKEIADRLVLKKKPKTVQSTDVERLGGLFDKETSTHQAGAVFDIAGLSPTLDTMQGGWRQPCIPIKNATEQGYLEAYEGDSVELSFPNSETRRGRVQKGLAPTLDTHNTVGVVEIDFSSNSEPEILQRPRGNNLGGSHSVSPTVTANSWQENNLLREPSFRIRKLTPLECWRLMGFSDTDYHKAVSVGISKSQLYKQAGNSIIVDVLEAIFKNLYCKPVAITGIDWS